MTFTLLALPSFCPFALTPCSVMIASPTDTPPTLTVVVLVILPANLGELRGKLGPHLTLPAEGRDV